ncbi:hypothetical protein LEP1GSC079_1143 [Leptospira interrogans str. FPW1039]|uniref:Uncharacterized protein n=1 Tax=Leptospira interrogans str. FPW1039 TaxID=1193040 RepID=A0A0F6ILF5_LEPIR|nr:hypothetical protein LEP1GSC079_1143 [Leptospira interrogans str. FPW1039]
MSVAQDIVTLFFSEFTINWATMATVVRVQEDPDDSGKPGLLTATVNGANKEDVRWYWPIKPAIGSRCIILFGDNNASRAIAIGFNKIAKIKTKVAELCEIEIDEQGFKIDHSQLLSVFGKLTEGKLTLKNGPTLEVALDSIQNKINFKGKGRNRRRKHFRSRYQRTRNLDERNRFLFTSPLHRNSNFARDAYGWRGILQSRTCRRYFFKTNSFGSSCSKSF